MDNGWSEKKTYSLGDQQIEPEAKISLLRITEKIAYIKCITADIFILSRIK